MTVFTFLIDFADGNDFTKTFTTAVTVTAPSALDARLAATQMAMAPMLGKPDHIQILDVTPVK